MILSVTSTPAQGFFAARLMSNHILLVTPASPFSPQSGAQQRTALLYEALRQHGKVDVLLLEPYAGPSRLAPPPAGILARAFWRQRPLGLGKYRPDAALDRLLRQSGVDLERYTLIVSRYLNPVAKLVLPPQTHTVVDLDDWHYDYAPRGIALAARLKSRYAAWLARRQLARFDAYFFVSGRDRSGHPELRAAVLPNIPFKAPAHPYPEAADSTTLLFVGALWYAPNRDGIQRFLDRCWPIVRAARPDARLLLVGAAPPAARTAWETHPGVTAPGFVDDLDAAYREAAVTIAPIFSGGGTNIKVLESLAYGRMCVTTSHCAKVFEPGILRGLELVDNDDAFASRCIALLGDWRLRAARIQESQAALRADYTREAVQRAVTMLLGPETPAPAPAPLPHPAS